jgi:hypothetical protein
MSFAVKVINLFLGVVALWLIKKVTEKKPLGRPIPGPKGWPIIGNLLDVPNEVEYKVFSQWRQKYGERVNHSVPNLEGFIVTNQFIITLGDLIQMTVLGQPTIIINSPQLATDILSKKSAIYSSRPHLTMACDLVGWKDVLVLLKYNDKFKACRRMLQGVIGTRTREVPGHLGRGVRTDAPPHIRRTRKLCWPRPQVRPASQKGYSLQVILID